MQVRINKDWQTLLQTEFDKPYFADLVSFVHSEYTMHRIYPPGKLIFNAFDACPPGKLKVVILGQDPYHGEGQAHGLCFSVNDGVPLPPSLVNIYKEISEEYGKPAPASGNLLRWANQGVLLLNATLTVRANIAGSHQGRGWETFTDAVIKSISDNKENVVFLLWGAYAGRKAELIDTAKHCVLKSAHPSPLSAYRGFFGNGHFRKANDYLFSTGQTPIDW